MYWLTGILGIALAVAPFVLGYSNHPGAMWTSAILGLVVVILSVIEAIDAGKGTWEYWIAGAVGIVAIAAPFILGFSTITWALWTTIAIGVLILLVSGYEVFVEQTTTR